MTHADVATAVPALGRPVLVGIDGVDGSGKSTYAAALATQLRASGRTVHVVHEDDFLQPRALRYRRGRDSPEGFYRDTYDEPRRMALRDGSHPDPEHPSMRRYVGGQRLYLAERAPRNRATYVVEHTVPATRLANRLHVVIRSPS